MGAANSNAFINDMRLASLFYPTLLSSTYTPISECHKYSTVCSCFDVRQ